MQIRICPGKRDKGSEKGGPIFTMSKNRKQGIHCFLPLECSFKHMLFLSTRLCVCMYVVVGWV